MRQVQKRKLKNNINMDYIDIREVLDDLNIPYTEQGKNVSEGWIGVQCPFPGCGDHSNHLGVHLSTPIVTCYNCGKSGNYLTFIAAELGSYSKAIQILEKHSPRELKLNTQGVPENETVSRVDLPDDAKTEMPEEHRQFLEKRGFDPHLLNDLYNFHYCGTYSHWSNRIIVPIYRRNKLITFTSISIEDDPYIRYKHLKKEESIIHCKNYLLGLDHVMGKSVIAVEGFFDMARIGPGCVCTFGTLTSLEQQKLLVQYSKVIIAFDGDNPGVKAAKQLGHNLAAFTDVEIIHLPKGKDPDSLNKKDIKELREMVKIIW